MRKAGEKLGYMLGVAMDRTPYETALKTNAGDFQAMDSQGLAVGSRYPRQQVSKLRGDVFNLDLSSSTGNPPMLPAPYVGGAELRNLDLSI